MTAAPPSRWLRRVVGLIAAAALATLAWSQLAPEPEASVASEAPPPPAPASAPAPIPETQTEVSVALPVIAAASPTPSRPSPKRDRAGSTAVAEAPVEIPVEPPKPEEPPPPILGALVTTRGDARTVFAERDGAVQPLPARLEPGRYRVLVSFDGLPERSPGGELIVEDSSSIVLNCRASFGKCLQERP